MLIVQSTQCEKRRVEPGEEQGMEEHATGPTLFYAVIGFQILCLLLSEHTPHWEAQETEDCGQKGLGDKNQTTVFN